MAIYPAKSRFTQIKYFHINLDAEEEKINKFLLKYPEANLLFINEKILIFKYMREIDIIDKP